jgi:hypothetical protein
MKIVKTMCGCGKEIYNAVDMVDPFTHNLINERFERPQPVSIQGQLGFYWTEHRCDKWPSFVTLFTDIDINK